MKERNIKNKLAIQKEKNTLNEKRDVAWREFDEKKTQLKADKNKLVTKLYDLAEAKVETVDEFSIKWRIKNNIYGQFKPIQRARKTLAQ